MSAAGAPVAMSADIECASAGNVDGRSSANTTSTSQVAPTTTISTIAVQSGKTRIVLALLQSAEWIELRIVELSPEMTYLGTSLQEVTSLRDAHVEVLAKLQSKQSPVEDLLNQADQLISTQRPRAEVYAAMAESLGLAWKDLNHQLETRKVLLDMAVMYHTRARQYSDAMDVAEKLYTDNILPSDAESVRQLLSSLHDRKREILETSMYTLQEAQALLGRLRSLRQEGASLDSRPQHIRTAIDFTSSQIEHQLESLHDRRKFLESLFMARKHHLEQCLALCVLYQDLAGVIHDLKARRDEVSEEQSLGDSQASAEVLLHEHQKRECKAKAIQDQCVRHVSAAEKMVSSGHYAGAEARSRTYSVLEAATALYEACDTRTSLLQQTILFFRLAHTALTKLHQAEVQVAALSQEGGGCRLSLVMGVVEESVQPALNEGYSLLEVTGGRYRPHNMGISSMVDELEKSRSSLSELCASSTEDVLQKTEKVNAFLERHNSIDSWLVHIGDAFLQGHQDFGGSVSLAKDFEHLHVTLAKDLKDKAVEINSLDEFLNSFINELEEEEKESHKDKIRNIREHCSSVDQCVEDRMKLIAVYVAFLSHADALTGRFEDLECHLRAIEKTEIPEGDILGRWHQMQEYHAKLSSEGKAFVDDVSYSNDPYLDIRRTILCVEGIMDNFGKRCLLIEDLLSKLQEKLASEKEMKCLWQSMKERIHQMHSEISIVEMEFCPFLRGDPSKPEVVADLLEKRLNSYVSSVKQVQEDMQSLMTEAELSSHRVSSGSADRDEIITCLLQFYKKLQNTSTEYQILGFMLVQWCKNIAEVHASFDKLEAGFVGEHGGPDFGDVESQLKEHDASRQAIQELLRFAQNEADGIIGKLRKECPPEAAEEDVAFMKEMMERRRKIYEKAWASHQDALERQLKKSQYRVDLQVISDQLDDLSDQLGSMKDHYGHSLPAAKDMQNSFKQFVTTVETLERRIQVFVSTAQAMLGDSDDSGDMKQELEQLGTKWSTFHIQVGDAQKSIELFIDFFSLVDEAENWYKEGSELLIAVAGESSNAQCPDDIQKLEQTIETFLGPGHEKQDERIRKISSLAIQLYKDATPKQVELVVNQNKHIVDSFEVVKSNLRTMAENLADAEANLKKQMEAQEEMNASLAAAQADAESARRAAAAAEEARQVAEEVARAAAVSLRTVSPEKAEATIQTDAYIMAEDFSDMTFTAEETPPPRKVKVIQEEPPQMSPVFLTPLVGASVTEGVKFSFECSVRGLPVPQVDWLKDKISIMDNPDYKTAFEDGCCSLTIEETFTADSAIFTCRATNLAGVAETSAKLVVKEVEPVELLSPAVFTKRLVDHVGKEGESFQFEATVEGHPLPVVSWSKGGTCVDNSPDYVITYNNGDCVLRFEELYLEDEAEYVCHAYNEHGDDVTKALLKVSAIKESKVPVFTAPLSNVMVRAGQKFKLQCTIEATPSPVIAWFHNNKPIKETLDCKLSFDGDVATLTISEAFPKNAGKYAVVAKNTAGEVQSSCSVSVKGRIPTETSDSEFASDLDVEPVKPSIQLALKDMTIQEGQSARLDCVIVGQPEPEVIWYHDNEPVKESADFKLLFHGDRCSLLIQEAFVEDAGLYRVVARNSAGEASTSSFLNVQLPSEATQQKAETEESPTSPPVFSMLLCDTHVTEGDPVTLKAVVSGEPKPTIAWFRDGIPLLPDAQVQIQEDPDGTGTVFINRADPDHSGQYEVVASNVVGTAKCVGFLSVEYRLPTPAPVEPTEEPPVFTCHIKDVAINSGKTAEFYAEVTGRPKPQVFWTLNDCVLTNQDYEKGVRKFFIEERGDVHTLSMPSASLLYNGRVAVIAENSAGKSVSAAHLEVIEPPAEVVIAMEKPLLQKEEIVSSSFSSASTMKMTSHVSFAESSHVASSVFPQNGQISSQTYAQTSTAASTSAVRQGTGESTVQVHETRIHNVEQKGAEPPHVMDKASFIRKEDGTVTHYMVSDSETKPASPVAPPPPSSIPAPPIPPAPQVKRQVGPVKRKPTPARFITPLQGAIAKEDDRVVFECVIDGFPDPSIIWTHNGKPVCQDVQMQVQLTKVILTIPRVNQCHSGRYTCCIDNEAGSAQSSCDLIVKKSQFPPVFGKRLQPSILGVGDRLHLEIEVTGTPTPEILWSKDGQALACCANLEIKYDGSRHWLVIPQVKVNNGGRYGVLASNSAGRAECFADVMITQMVGNVGPTRPGVQMLDADSLKRESEKVVESQVKQHKRAVDEVTAEPSEQSLPAKISKIPLVVPSPPAPLPMPTTSSEEETEVRRLTGKLKTSWPPPPMDVEEMERQVKIDPSAVVSKDKVSAMVSTFSTIDESSKSGQEYKQIFVPRPVTAKQKSEDDLIFLKPELEPEYGIISQVVEHPEKVASSVLESIQVETSSPTMETLELTEELEVTEKIDESLERQDVPGSEQEEPSADTEVMQSKPELLEEPSDFTEVGATEKETKETSFTESKVSFSSSSYTSVETKTYRFGAPLSPDEQIDIQESFLQEIEPQEVHENLRTKETTIESEDVLKQEPCLEYITGDHVCDSEKGNEVPITQLVPDSDKVYAKQTIFENPAEFLASSIVSEDYGQASYTSSAEVETKYLPQDNTAVIPEEKYFVLHAELDTQVNLIPEAVETTQPKEAILVPESTDEQYGKPPKVPEVEEKKEVRESTRRKKKKESVKQIAMRLEETIVPMSPDEVPGGVLLFPSKQAVMQSKEESVLKRSIDDVSPLPLTLLSEKRSSSVDTIDRIDRFLELEPFPFEVEVKPTAERPKVPLPSMPKKFVATSFSDREYESDHERSTGFRFIPKKIKFQPQIKPRSMSLDREPPPPSEFSEIPLFSGMRPDIIKKEYGEEEKVKQSVPKKKPKIVTKFLAAAGEGAEEEVVRTKPHRLPVSTADHEKVLLTRKPGKLAKEWPPPSEKISVISLEENLDVPISVTSIPTSSAVHEIQPSVENFSHELNTLGTLGTSEFVVKQKGELTKPITQAEIHTEHQPVVVSYAVSEKDDNIQKKETIIFPTEVKEIGNEIHLPDLNVQASLSDTFLKAETVTTRQETFKENPVCKPTVVPELVPPTLEKVAAVSEGDIFEEAPTASPVFIPVTSQEICPSFHRKKTSESVYEQDMKSQTFLQHKEEIRKESSIQERRSVKTSYQFEKPRSFSSERTSVTEAPSLPVRPHEAPSVFWSSNVTVKESRAPWTPTTTTHSQRLMESREMQFCQEEKSVQKTEIESYANQTVTPKVKELDKQASIPTKQMVAGKLTTDNLPEKSQPVAPTILEPLTSMPRTQANKVMQVGVSSPQVSSIVEPPHKGEKYEFPSIEKIEGSAHAPKICTIKEPLQTFAPEKQLVTDTHVFLVANGKTKPAPMPNVQRATVKSPPQVNKFKEQIKPVRIPAIKSAVPTAPEIAQYKPIPSNLEPFPFQVPEPKPKMAKHIPPPSMPKKFIPGFFTESDYDSDLDNQSFAYRPYMSDGENGGYRRMNLKLGTGRQKKPKAPSPPAPSQFDEPPSLDGLMKAAFSASDLLYGVPYMDVPKMYIQPSFVSKSESQTAPSMHRASSVPSVRVRDHFLPAHYSEQSHRPTSWAQGVMSKHGVANIRKIFDKMDEQKPVKRFTRGISPATHWPVPQKDESSVYNVDDGSSRVPQLPVSGLEVASDSSPSSAFDFTTQEGTVKPTEKLQGKFISIGMQKPAVMHGNAKPKPLSPKSKKKELAQMSKAELEESGYVADTEGTLPKSNKQHYYQESESSGHYTSSSSFMKSESHMMSSHSEKTEFSRSKQVPSFVAGTHDPTKTGRAAIFDYLHTGENSIGSQAFSPLGSGNVPSGMSAGGGNFPPAGGPTPPSFPFPTMTSDKLASNVSVTSSTYSSSESKSSQVKKLWSFSR